MVRDRLQSTLGLVGTACSSENFIQASTAFVTEMGTRFDCDRVSLGFVRNGHVRVVTLSHSAKLDKHTNLLHGLGRAMDEALDQRSVIVFPTRKDHEVLVTRAHAELVKQFGTECMCTIPLTVDGRSIGALMLERPAEKPFDPYTVEICKSAAAIAGPLLESRRREERWLLTKAADSGWTFVKRLLGPRHTVLKLCTFVLLSLIAFFMVAHGDYRVSAEAILEPSQLRAIVSPYDGYIAEANFRAGKLVQKGQTLCRLDDREKRLERLKWMSQLQELRKEYDKAMAAHELAEIRILSAQIDQAKAQLALIEDQLTHLQLLAPYDGVVVSGDLSQKLGSPVEQGEVLFEVAPLDAYRLIVQVDERDITDIQVGQQGQLLLSSFPKNPLPFTVENVTPVSTADEGRNYFRVEAQLDEKIERLRPAMEGVGKIEVDDRLLIWIWTHDIVDWVRLTMWAWLP